MDQIDALRTGLEKVAVPSILSELDSGAIAGINAAAAQLLGAPVAQLLGTNVGSFVRRHERCARSAPGEALLTGAVEVQERGQAGGEPTLHRSIGPTQMALYGLGSMLGAGVYGLMQPVMEPVLRMEEPSFMWSSAALAM